MANTDFIADMSADQLAELMLTWVDQISDMLADQVGIGGMLALLEYEDIHRVSTIGELVEPFELEIMLNLTNNEMLQTQHIFTILERVTLASGFEALCDMDEAVKCVENCIEDDADWERALSGLMYARMDLLDAEPDHMMRAFNIGRHLGSGVIRAIGKDPRAIIDGLKVGSELIKWSRADAKFERAIERWDLEVSRFAWSTLKWRDNAKEHLKELLDNAAEQAAFNVDEDQFEDVLLAMQQDITAYGAEFQRKSEQRFVDFNVGIEDNSCPRCQRQYPADVDYCHNCQVGL